MFPFPTQATSPSVVLAAQGRVEGSAPRGMFARFGSAPLAVYLAARYARREELAGYARELRAVGVAVTSRWLTGVHAWTAVPDEAIPREAQAGFAREDLVDIEAADVVVCFTEGPDTPARRGGRHVELGYALGTGKRVMAVGPIENVFVALPQVAVLPDWAAARDGLAALARERRGRR